jgi:5-formyltetrahydrofolate cyclo-ligase
MRDKEELRAELVGRRRALSPDEVEAASRAIGERALAAVEWRSVRTLHVYRSNAAWGEVDTAPLVAAVQARWPAVSIVHPGIDRDEPVPAEPFDVIVVPVVGYDREYNRLGLGGGWYDRFLAGQPDARKVGLAYAWALVQEGIPVEPQDVRLDLIITA